MKTLLSLILFLSNIVHASIKEAPTLCESTKEYVTVYRFLKAKKEFSLKKEDILKISDDVSKGCKGPAGRFIKIINILTRAGLETSNAINIALKIAKTNEHKTETFLTIFKESFLKDYLDLDLKTAVEISLSLSLKSQGDPVFIKKDYQKVVRFCLSNKGLDLSGPKCSKLASDIATIGTKYKTEIASEFISLFEFINSKDGVSLSSYQAIELSKEIVRHGPTARKNFSLAYQFAISKEGLDLEKVKAIDFAKLMAVRSNRNSIEDSQAKK